jgi:hypothetical protein
MVLHGDGRHHRPSCHCHCRRCRRCRQALAIHCIAITVPLLVTTAIVATVTTTKPLPSIVTLFVEHFVAIHQPSATVNDPSIAINPSVTIH